MRPLLRLVLPVAIAVPLFAATVDVQVQDARGRGVRDAVVYAVPDGQALPLKRKTAVMDQKNRMFIPHVLPVQTGTAVRFPNSDDIRHHVYSFSPAKPFQLPLYKGTPANPEVFGLFPRAQSTLTLADLIIGHHLAISAFCQSPSACGVD